MYSESSHNRLFTQSHTHTHTMDNRDATCTLCGEGKAAEKLFTVSVCTNRCAVTVHKSCFDSRKSQPYWKKKHASRSNGDAELCCVSSCMGKLSKIRFREMDSKEQKLGNRNVADSITETFEGQCCFHANNGLPCRRVAVRDGACGLHARNAALLKEMVNKSASRKNGFVDASSNTECISKKHVDTDTSNITYENAGIQTHVPSTVDATTQCDPLEGHTRRDGAHIRENIKLQNIVKELKKELAKVKNEVYLLKMQLEDANEHSKVASMAYRTMEHEHSRLQFILQSQQKENTAKKDAVLKQIQLMLDNTVF